MTISSTQNIFSQIFDRFKKFKDGKEMKKINIPHDREVETRWCSKLSSSMPELQGMSKHVFQ